LKISSANMVGLEKLLSRMVLASLNLTIVVMPKTLSAI